MTNGFPTIVNLHERETRLFPRNELFAANGESLILPETQDMSVVDMREVKNGIDLRALGVIGYLPLTKNIVLNLKPKFPLENLWHMLSVAENSYNKIYPILRSYERQSTAPPHLLLCRAFCHHLNHITTHGFIRQYCRESRIGFYKPKINLARTMSSFLSRGDTISVHSDSFSFTADVNPNSVLKSACIDFLRIIPRTPDWLVEKNILLSALSDLHNVESKKLERSDLNLHSNLPIKIKDEYRFAFSLYSMLLGYSSVGFSYESRGIDMLSFLFSLDDIFERFIRNTLQAGFRPKSISVTDGNFTRHQVPLFEDNKKFPIKPDVIFKSNRLVIGMAEVKYKPKLKEVDRYQVISHVVGLKSPLGIWISPRSEGQPELEYIGKISSDAKFYHYRFDLHSDIKKSQESMISRISDLLK